MWIWLVIGSALLLGLYDVAKKKSLQKNSVMTVLFVSTAMSTLLMLPFFGTGPLPDHLRLILKAVLVTGSWVSGLAAMALIPLSTLSTIKASRPVFVLLFSIIIFGERLNAMQWAGSILAIASLFLLSRTSRREGIVFSENRGILFAALSVITGVASALYDKHILRTIDPLFVQCWTNLYITLAMGLILLVQTAVRHSTQNRFRWDWCLPMIAVLITAADFLYFRSLSSEGSMLSVVSMVRRGSVLVPFLFGATIWHEKNVARKGVILAVMLSGITLITLGTI